jgi:hypothetical protein
MRKLMALTFVFTFILSNTKEFAAIAPLSGKMFVQAASVDNSYVELR